MGFVGRGREKRGAREGDQAFLWVVQCCEGERGLGRDKFRPSVSGGRGRQGFFRGIRPDGIGERGCLDVYVRMSLLKAAFSNIDGEHGDKTRTVAVAAALTVEAEVVREDIGQFSLDCARQERAMGVDGENETEPCEGRRGIYRSGVGRRTRVLEIQ